MIDPMTGALAVSTIGSVLGGRSRKKAAAKQQKKALKKAELDRQEALNFRNADQAEAVALAREDEARMGAAHREAVGYDLVRLRDEAMKAGFNPLTVLENTGAANYARTPAPVLSSPFFARPVLANRLDAVLGTGAARVETSGYMGDAIAGAASGYIGISQEKARLQADRDLTAALMRPNNGTGGGGFPQTAQPVDARPVEFEPGFIGPLKPVNVNTPWGWRQIRPDAAARIGISDGEWLTGGDLEDLLGEVGGNITSTGDLLGPNGPFMDFKPGSYDPGTRQPLRVNIQPEWDQSFPISP